MVLFDYQASQNDYDYVDHLSSHGGWNQMAETTLPLMSSKLAGSNRVQFQSSIEIRSKQISTKVILINSISLLINLALAVVAFYFSFAKDSTATTAFAADCLLDLISSAILLWRYYGDLDSFHMQAREQIACIYLGALFELSAVGIIIKSISDIVSDPSANVEELVGSYELVYLAIVATLACSVLTVFKCALFKVLRDKSILLDVINTLISTVFAMSIVMSQAMINVDPSFWYLDPILSIVLSMFMMGFGIKVIHQNFNILKPNSYNYSGTCDSSYGSFTNSRGQSQANFQFDSIKIPSLNYPLQVRVDGRAHSEENVMPAGVHKAG